MKGVSIDREPAAATATVGRTVCVCVSRARAHVRARALRVRVFLSMQDRQTLAWMSPMDSTVSLGLGALIVSVEEERLRLDLFAFF